MQSTTRFGGPDNGRVLFKARLVLYLRRATGQRFLFVRVMLGRSACGPSTRRHRVILAALIALMILTTGLFLAWGTFQFKAAPTFRIRGYPSTVTKKRGSEGIILITDATKGGGLTGIPPA
jgi:hypothetical protein